MICCMQPFCLLVEKILSCGDCETSDFFQKSGFGKFGQLALVRFRQVSSARYLFTIGNYSSRMIVHGKILSLAVYERACLLGLGRYTDTSMYQDTWPDDMRIDTCYVVSIF